MPKVEIITPNPLKFKAIVSILPEISAPKLKDIKVPKAKKISIKKTEIEETKKALCEKFTELKKQERKAKKGDLVEIDFDGFDEKGVALEGTASKHHPVQIGSNAFIPGFEDELIGLKSGDKKSFKITFPKDYGKKEFQGKKVRFDIKVHEVFEKVVPKFDEALIEKLVGEKKSVKEMEKEIEDSLKEKYTKEDMQRRENEFIENLSKLTKIDMPDVLVEEELDNIITRMKEDVQKAQMIWEKHLEKFGKTEADVRNDLRKTAEKNAHARLAFQALLKENKPKVSEKEIEANINQIMIKVPADQKKQAEKYFAKGKNGWSEVEFELIVRKFFEKILKS
jgi:trigger factor